ncbi:Isoquinoline 1-oxidoreductase subunit [Sphingomonas sp. MMS24-J45]|uniref:Isoquinoline 1-oxidoreductase subunit n=1 Tax=Sphingomonas sp. MMS24-J45 TaxID=3238806 RepID=UPI00384D80E6
MRGNTLALIVAALALPVALVARPAGPAPATLKDPEAFASIADPAKRSVALFGEMGKVIQSPRCLNCHPRSDRPNQGEAMTPHNPPVIRGADGHGAPGLECATCHGTANVKFANGTGSVPGAPHWALAPASMAWEGKSLAQICVQIKDRARNGGKSLADLIEHNGKDELVGWGWHPGLGRTPAPGTQVQFGALTKAWVDSGAKCPA